MKARANAIFISNIYNQDVGDTNWNEYQTIITANNVNELTIRASDTTANNLSVTSNYSSLSQGSKIYVSNNNTTLVGGIIGAVTGGTVKSNTSNKVVDTTRSAASGNTIYTVTSPAHSNPMFVKPDGTMLWICGSEGIIREWRLNVPWNPASGVLTGRSLPAVNANSQSKHAFCFSYDGRYLFRCAYWSGYGNVGVSRYTLSKPWDITTLSAKFDHRALNMYAATFTDNRNMRISRDGKTILIFGPNNNTTIYRNVLSKAFDITTYTSGTSFAPTGMNGEYANWEVSEDGKTWWAWSYASGTVINLYQGSFSTAWDPSTMSVSKTIPLTGFSTQGGTASNIYPPVGFISADGKTTWIWFQSGGGIATYNLETQGGDAAMSYNIDISGFGMSAAPTRAWLSQPNVYVALTRTANNLYVYPYQIELDTDTPATTTQAVVGIDATGVLQAGDKVLLNGTTEVTLTSVTETANGLSFKDPANTTDYIRYYGKNFQTSISTILTGFELAANMHIRISNNGSYVYVISDNGGSTATYGSGLYQYILKTPWDISTAEFLDFCHLGSYTSVSSSFNSSYVRVGGFDMDPNGRRFFVMWITTTASAKVFQYNLANPHDINSISSVNGPYDYTGYSSGASSSFACARFNRTGTQIFVKNDQSASAYYTQYLTLSTPYDITTVSSWAANFFGSNSPSGIGIDGCFTPSGDYFLSLGSSYNDSYLYTQPVTGANNSWTNGFVWNNKSTASSNVADYPAGSITGAGVSARGMDISPDGTKLYIITKGGQIFQFATRLKTLNKYVITYPTQASAPTSVFLPDVSVLQTLTPTLDGANNTIVYTGTNVSANGRAVQFELTGAPVDTEVTQVRINLKKSQ
jgi:hypothetical protein